MKVVLRMLFRGKAWCSTSYPFFQKSEWGTTELFLRGEDCVAEKGVECREAGNTPSYLTSNHTSHVSHGASAASTRGRAYLERF